MNKIYKSLILLIYLCVFMLTCDYRAPASTGGDQDGSNVYQLEISSDPIISIADLQQKESADIYVRPLDENGVFVSDANIAFQLVNSLIRREFVFQKYLLRLLIFVCRGLLLEQHHLIHLDLHLQKLKHYLSLK